MRRQSAIITTAALVLVLVGVAIPSAEAAGPLLSGYGGPGQGNQAILGAALLNGPSGGGGGGSQSPATTPGTSSSASSQSPSGAGASTGAKSHGGGARSTRGPSAGASAGRPRAYSSSSGLTAPQAAVGGAPALGLSGADLVYIILALGALAVTAAFTVRLAHRGR